MAKRNLNISSILGGHQPSEVFGGDDQFLDSAGVDPDVSGAGLSKSSGYIRPKSFSASQSLPNSIISFVVPKVTEPALSSSDFIDKAYAITDAGEIFSFDEDAGSLSNKVDQGSVSGDRASSANYYKDYIYIFGTGTDGNEISRFGPISGSSPTIENDLITGGVIDWTNPAGSATLADFYEHPYQRWSSHVHGDGQLYVLDYSTAFGQAIVHSIKMDTDGNDTGSEYNVLDLPSGYRATDITNLGTDIVIAATLQYSSLPDFYRGKSALFIWDPTDDISFYRRVDVPMPYISVVYNKNNNVYIFGARENDRGVVVAIYNGGYTTTIIDAIDDAAAPFPEAVDTIGERIVFGSDRNIYAYGYHSPRIGDSTARHNIGRISNEFSSIRTLNYALPSSNSDPKLVVGASEAIEETDDTNLVNNPAVFKSEVFNVGQQFGINKIALPLGKGIDTNTEIDVTINYDNGAFSKSLTQINSTNFDSGERRVVYKSPELDTDQISYYNFYIEIQMKSDEGIMLPIQVQVEVIDD